MLFYAADFGLFVQQDRGRHVAITFSISIVRLANFFARSTAPQAATPSFRRNRSSAKASAMTALERLRDRERSTTSLKVSAKAAVRRRAHAMTDPGSR
jgi:hypothetical protein